MSSPKSTNPTAYQKQSLNVYTMMLLLSLIALIAAIVMLYLELNRYSDQFLKWWDTAGAQPAISQLAPPSVTPPATLRA